MEGMLLGYKGLLTTAVVNESSGCSILGIINVTPLPLTLLDVTGTLLLVVVAAVAALFLPFLATDITLVDLSAFF
jgi:hypothetical protein